MQTEFMDFKDGPEPLTVSVPRPIQTYRIGLQTGAVTRYVEIPAYSLADAIEVANRLADAACETEGAWF